MVRAKFKATKNEAGYIVLEAVVGGSEENDNFFKWTPSGSIAMGTINEEASKQFIVGKEYYVDFTAADHS